MGLRGKINLIVLIFVLIIMGGLAVTALVREDVLREELARAAVAGNESLWSSIVASNVQRLSDQSQVALSDDPLRSALVVGEITGIAEAAGSIFDRLQLAGAATRLDVVDATGTVVYSTFPAFEPDVSLSERTVQRMLEEGHGFGGIGNDASRNVTVSYGIPLLQQDGEPIGLVVYGRDIREVLDEFRSGTGAEALIVNRRGRLLEGTDPDLWPKIRADLALESGSTAVVEADDRVYSVTSIPISADLGNLVAFLAVVQDTTDAYLDSQRVSLISFGAIALFLAGALTFLSYYMHRLLSPLVACVEVLAALTRGDTHLTVPVEGEKGRDEIAQIAKAINIFRRQTMQVMRQRRLQERRRRQQERFIRQEMTRLAGTLSKGARVDVLEDLAAVERQARKMVVESGDADAVEGAADGLQLMGLAFERMTSRVSAQQERLTKLVNDLQAALKTKVAYFALRHDLDIAKRVQQSFLPGSSFAAGNVRIRAIMKAAKNVGGDFYDFFALDDHRIGIVIADVAGKGVPAALFMAVTRTLIRANATHAELSPGACLEAVNDMLVDSTREEIFVTVFYGVFDLRTGVLTYANGGHNPPCLVAGGEVESLPLTGGVVLSMFKGLKYRENTVEVPLGGKVFFYTDGVNEAVNVDDEEFGDNRMHASLQEIGSGGPGDTIEHVVRDVESFAGHAEQADDITMVVLGREAPEDRHLVRRIALSNDIAELRRLLAELESFCRDAEIDTRLVGRFELVLDEIFTNIVNYAFPEGGKHEVEVCLSYKDGEVEMIVEDSGVEFNVTQEAPTVDPRLKMEDRVVGGLGIYLVQSTMDDVDYVRIRDRNRLTIRKRISS